MKALLCTLTASLLLFSCGKKEENNVYECQCVVTVTVNGITDTNEEDDTIQDVSKAEAEQDCDEYKALLIESYSDSGVPPDDVSCTLVELN